MGDMAEYYDSRGDEYSEAEYFDFDGNPIDVANAKMEFLDILRGYYRKNNIRYTAHLIYQNHLMDSGYSTIERQRIAAELYHINSAKKVKETCICPSCGASFVKGSYQQKFCKAKLRGQSSCKDFFHNFTNPKRMERLNWL